MIKCAKCGAANRVRSDAASGKTPVCGRCGATLPASSSTPVVITDSNFAAIVESSPLPVLLDMWAAWCGPCRLIAPTIETLAKELAGRVLVGKLDVDANPQTASRFGVQSIPTLLILKNGREAGRIVGVQSK
ncbi:MAG TPA: thioredoxin, partial [Pyrinomonadaceae bacterium]|nr:thioredoxin [Pyrinomonadaceae bacterium]